MPSSPVITEILPGGLAAVTLNRPEIHNAFDDRLIADLTAVFQRLEADDDVRIVMLAARGKSFSAGGDLNWMRRMAGYTRKENVADAERLARLMSAVNGMSKPTIAKVQGAAIGGGVGLVACCDIAVASEEAEFGFSEVRLGLIPAAIGPYVVAAIGARQARRYFLTGERFSAEEAKRLGLVHEVAPGGELDSAVEQVIAELRKAGRQAQKAAQELVRAVEGKPADSLIHETARRLADVRASAEAREGIQAFLDKRKPRW